MVPRILVLLSGVLLLALRPMTVDDQFRFQNPSASMLSPNGRWVLYAVQSSSLTDNKVHDRSWIAPADGSAQPRPFLDEGDSNPMWAPDSQAVWFLRPGASGAPTRLFRQDVGEGVARPVGELPAGDDGGWQLCANGSFFLVVRGEDAPDAPGAQSDVTFVNEGSNGQTRAT
jgi:hypothetical protein